MPLCVCVCVSVYLASGGHVGHADLKRFLSWPIYPLVFGHVLSKQIPVARHYVVVRLATKATHNLVSLDTYAAVDFHRRHETLQGNPRATWQSRC